MNTENDWKEAIKNIKVERERKEFKLAQLKLEHFYFNSGDIDDGMPVSTSIELVNKYNFEEKKEKWQKTISHTYINLGNESNEETNTYEEVLENEEIIKELEKYDLRDLNNNYFTEEAPEKYSYWTLSYNYKFKIVGTYDQEIDEFKNIKNILGFEEIIKEKIK